MRKWFDSGDVTYWLFMAAVSLALAGLFMLVGFGVAFLLSDCCPCDWR